MAEGNGETAQHSKCANEGNLNSHPESYDAYRNEFYNMDHKFRGKALIFGHDRFDIDLLDRPGNAKDCENLEKCLKELAFSVDSFRNLKYAQIMEHIDKTARKNHSKNDCLLIAVSTHGDESGVLYANDTHYRSENLWSRFTDENCPTLAGKPKLFILQACQGKDYDDGITLRSDVETDGWFEPHTIPHHPDFLLALSGVPGYFAWRKSKRGSWFIEALCEELNNSATEMDILTLLTVVNRKVALNYESNTDHEFSSYKKQVPSFSSMLTRRLVFTKKPNSSSSQKSLLDYFKKCSVTN